MKVTELSKVFATGEKYDEREYPGPGAYLAREEDGWYFFAMVLEGERSVCSIILAPKREDIPSWVLEEEEKGSNAGTLPGDLK